MQETWHHIKNVSIINSDQISADVEVDKDSPWFKGHFPGKAILPGIAQIGMAFEVIKGLQQSLQLRLKVNEIRKIRFTQIIVPGDAIRITAEANKNNPLAFTFKITANGKLACKGIIQTDKIND